jgi:hypothetical protein
VTTTHTGRIERTLATAPPEALFLRAVKECVRANEEYMPPPAFTRSGSLGHVLAAEPVAGTVSKFHSRLPVAASNARTCPTAPTSLPELPMYTLPSHTTGATV